MGELLALTSALCFGLAHFVNGTVARRRHGLTVALCAQTAGTAVSVAVALIAWQAPGSPAALGWGALSGIGTGVGVGCLYWSMNHSPICVVVPVSNVTAVGVPVLVGIALLGERPSALDMVGILAALPAVWLVSRADATSGAGTRDGSRGLALALVAGVGLGVQFLAMARIPEEAGWWPVAVSRAVSGLVILLVLLAVRAPTTMPPRPAAAAGGAGVLGTLAIVLYLLATQRQLMTVAVVLASLYPAIPVLLALAVLHERVNRVQATGLLCAAGAVALIALS